MRGENVRVENIAVDPRRRRIAAGIIALGAGALGLRAGGEAAEEVIRIVATKFVFTPSEIRLKKGSAVILELTSIEVPMGFSAPDFGVRADMIPGKISRLRIVPDKTGTFDFVCDVFCGSGHEDMSGTIVVT